VGVTARSPVSSNGVAALHDEGYRFVVAVVPRPSDFDAQGHLNNAAIVRIFNDIRIEYIRQRIGERWPDHLREKGIVVVAREVHVLYESEGLPAEEFVGAMRYMYREGRAAVIEQRLIEAATARGVARAWVVQLLARDGNVAEWPGFYFDLVAVAEGREIEQRASVRRPWGPERAGACGEHE
jgi:acyl-CoA thioesterase FadM